MRNLLLASLAVLTWAHLLAGQEVDPRADSLAACRTGMLEIAYPTDPLADYVRTAELAGAAPLRSHTISRPSSLSRWPACRGPGALRSDLVRRPRGGLAVLRVAPLAVESFYNSAYPRDRNNGAVWAGRGLTMAYAGGVRGRVGPVSFGIRPRLIHHANEAFDIRVAQLGQYSDYMYLGTETKIDYPQRFGEEPFWTTDPGPSYLRVDAFGFAAGVSTENLVWGPARLNPIVLGGTAPGFPHAFIGTSRPVDVFVGDLELETFAGRLEESEYFDGDPRNDRRFFTGVVATLQPRLLPGLHVGAMRTFMMTIIPDSLSLFDYFERAYTSVADNPREPLFQDNQLLSLFVRWAHAQSGFEAYGEWAREDHWENLDELIRAPDASQAYTLGFQQVVDHGDWWLRFYGELTHLSDALPILHVGRGVLMYYTHWQVRQGHTHRGQLLGAAIGPGADAQTLGLDLFTRWGMTGLYAARTRYSDDAYQRTWAQYYAAAGHDVELTAGLRQRVVFGDLVAELVLTCSHRRNRDFLGLENFVGASREDWEFPTETNLGVRLGLSWYPEIGVSFGSFGEAP